MLVAFIIILFLAWAVFAFWKVSKKDSDALRVGTVPLPGPAGLPFIGVAHQLSTTNPWMTFHNWALKYGGIYQCTIAGQNHVWISDEHVAQELLAKRGAIYSDRPHIPALIDDNRTSGQYLPLMSHNAIWERQRKFAKKIMSTSHNAAYYGYPELESKRLMMELMNDPSKYNHSLESFISRVTCRLAWGTPDASDELKQRARELLIGVSPAGSLANKLAFIMSMPEWLVPAKAWERRRKDTERAFLSTMQNEVKSDIEQERGGPSWMKTFYQFKESLGFRDELEGAYVVGMHGIAGALTIAAPMQAWCLAMCLYPQYLPKLHEEIDRVCGNTPPSYADMPKMPYLRASIREALRWRPAVPTGIPHELSQDDVYNGYHIPAKSVIHPIEWSMSRNPTKYPQPDAYNPHRWLDESFPTYQEPLSKYPTIAHYTQFGFGRRVCQGQEVAEVDMFVGIGAMAWAFNIGKKRNPETGLEIHIPECDNSDLLIAKPKWFEFDIKPRDEARRELIVQMFDEENERGSFTPSRVYWDQSNPKLGWGKV